MVLSILETNKTNNVQEQARITLLFQAIVCEKWRSYLPASFITVIFCAGMLCPREERWLVFILTALLAIYAVMRYMKREIRFTVIHIPLTALPVFYLISSVANDGLTFYAVGQIMLMCVPLLASVCIKDLNEVFIVVTIGVCFLAIMSLLGLFVPFISNTFTPAGHNSDPRPRLQTLLGYANTGGALLGCGIFALLGIKANTQFCRVLKHILILLVSSCLILTLSRFAISQITILLCGYFLIKNKRNKTLLFCVIALLTIALAVVLLKTEWLITSTLAFRFIYWLDAFKVFITNPVLGVGPEVYIFRVHEYQSAIYVIKQVHCAWLQAAVDAGLPALLALTVIFILAIKQSWRKSREMTFILLMLLLHSSVDITLGFFSAVMILGMCSSSLESYANEKKKIVFHFATCSVSLVIIIVSVYLAVGEYFHTQGEHAALQGEYGVAEQAYKTGLRVMPNDFRTTYKLAWLYIHTGKPKEAVKVLTKSHYQRFNSAVRSELLVIAYKKAGLYEEWGNETLELLKHAPRRQSAYSERLDYLSTARNRMILTEQEYEAEYASLVNALNTINKTMNILTQFIPEKDRTLKLEQLE
jgi:hypothetical protein